MNDLRPNPPCVFPAASEMEVGTLRSSDGESAFRVRVEPGREGYVRLEQLAHSADMGWYCQKSFVVPAEFVRELGTLIRKADCFLPQPAARSAVRDPLAPLPLRLTEPLPHDEPDTAARRDA